MQQFQHLMACYQAPASGQSAEITASGNYTVPAGVYSVGMAAVQGAGQADPTNAGTSITVAGVIVCHAKNGARIGDGGGDGFSPATATDGTIQPPTGGGGAGGYSGNGGSGTGGCGGNGENGAAGWGAGGGGGVGLKGEGASGANASGAYPGDFGGTNGRGGGGGSGGANGNTRSTGSSIGGTGGSYGGGTGGSGSMTLGTGKKGGALAWKNSVAVYPGQLLTLSFGGGGGGGGVRFVWGPGRSYPSNAGDV